MNSLYEESKTTRWNLQCNAGYQSDYQILSKDLEKSSHYKHAFPSQCPVIKDEEIGTIDGYEIHGCVKCPTCGIIIPMSIFDKKVKGDK